MAIPTVASLRYNLVYAGHLRAAHKRVPVLLADLQNLKTHAAAIDFWMRLPDLCTAARSSSGPDRRAFRVQRIAHEIGRARKARGRRTGGPVDRSISLRQQ